MGVAQFESTMLQFISELKEIESAGLEPNQTVIKFKEVGLKYGINSADQILDS